MKTKLLNQSVINSLDSLNYSGEYRKSTENIFSWSYCSDGSCSGDCVGGCDGTPAGGMNP